MQAAGRSSAQANELEVSYNRLANSRQALLTRKQAHFPLLQMPPRSNSTGAAPKDRPRTRDRQPQDLYTPMARGQCAT